VSAAARTPVLTHGTGGQKLKGYCRAAAGGAAAGGAAAGSVGGGAAGPPGGGGKFELAFARVASAAVYG
jgi:hypothetical protein